MKERLFEEFDIYRMSAHSLQLKCKRTGEIVYIHRNSFNAIDSAVDYRVVPRTFDRGITTNWIEILIWKAN